MSGKDRRRYLTETVLNQEFLDWSHDNFENKLEMILEIETPIGTIYASDRNKYVGPRFYEALLVFPVINKTVGEWLSPQIQFSGLTVELSNADERFNNILPGGAAYNSWIGKSVIVKIGLGQTASTYTTVFSGTITDIGGLKRSVKSITVIARDNYDKLSVTFPNTALTGDSFPDLDDQTLGTILPVIYGDFTTGLGDKPAIVTTYIVNGLAILPPTVMTDPPNTTNLQIYISENDLLVFDNTLVYLKRGQDYVLVPSSEVTSIGPGNRSFEVMQNTAVLWVPQAGAANIAYAFTSGDIFYVQVKGKDLSGFNDNLVWQARDILMTHAGLGSGDFNANWFTYRSKASPAQSAILNIKSRVWIQEPIAVIEYALSMLEQVRLEAFIDRNQTLKLNSLQFEDWNAIPTFTLKNWDIVKDTFVPALDERNNFNRAQGEYDFHPDAGANAFTTAIYKNTVSISQIGKAISKDIVFPNLYIESDVVYQIIEILRIASSMFEIIDLQATWRSLLQDIGNFVNIDVKIGSVQFDTVPAMIRNIGYDPAGVKIPMRLWSFMMCPFPGYVPGFAGTVGGYNATITKET